jgi:hypothetical protein
LAQNVQHASQKFGYIFTVNLKLTNAKAKAGQDDDVTEEVLSHRWHDNTGGENALKN